MGRVIEGLKTGGLVSGGFLSKTEDALDIRTLMRMELDIRMFGRWLGNCTIMREGTVRYGRLRRTCFHSEVGKK